MLTYHIVLVSIPCSTTNMGHDINKYYIVPYRLSIAPKGIPFWSPLLTLPCEVSFSRNELPQSHDNQRTHVCNLNTTTFLPPQCTATITKYAPISADTTHTITTTSRTTSTTTSHMMLTATHHADCHDRHAVSSFGDQVDSASPGGVLRTVGQ